MLRQLEEKSLHGDEQGQAIVVIAFAIIALILFAGLALDAATVYAGQSKLNRAVDAAALAGVVELPNEDAALARTRQFMLANGFDTADGESVPLFQTGRVPSTEYIQWAVTATHRVPLNFLPLINFDYAAVTEVAVAEYRAMVDIYTTQTGGRGIVGPVNLSNWGRWSNPRWGDAFTPQCWTCSSGCDAAGAGKDFCPDPGPNPDHTELYNQFSQGYPFRIHIPPAYDSDDVQIELLDPDGYNQPFQGSVTISCTTPVDTVSRTDCADRLDACLLDTCDQDEDINDYWFMRIDENRSFGRLGDGGRPDTYTPENNTQTEYRLYYHKQLADQSILREDIGTYVGWATEVDDLADDGDSTDLEWIVPWTVDVSCDDGCDVPNIVVNEDDSRSLYLEVDGVTGYSENGFDLWAGPPPPITETIPTNVNDRNLYLLWNPNSHDAGGIVTFGSGYMPLNTNASGLITMTFAFIPPEASGVGINLYHFDNDSGSLGQQIDYYLEGVSDWHNVGTLSLNGTWSTSLDAVYQAPGSRDHDGVAVPDEFYGGYLLGRYQTGYLDTSSWRIEYEGVVGDMFVRLIR
ncbi:MAG: Tad domain-containing protein [Anaerolineae bacterium]